MTLLLLIPILIGWFFATRWLARRVTSGITTVLEKQLAMWVLVPLLFLLPLADEIVGGIYMRSLCHTDGGDIFYKPLNTIHRAKIETLPAKETWFGYLVVQNTRQYIDIDSGQVFGQERNYWTHGGFVLRHTFRNTASCGRYEKNRTQAKTLQETYKQLNQLLKAGETK